MHFTMRLLGTVDRYTLTFVATRAAELFRRMGAIREENLALRVGLERIFFLRHIELTIWPATFERLGIFLIEALLPIFPQWMTYPFIW